MLRLAISATVAIYHDGWIASTRVMRPANFLMLEQRAHGRAITARAPCVLSRSHEAPGLSGVPLTGVKQPLSLLHTLSDQHVIYWRSRLPAGHASLYPRILGSSVSHVLDEPARAE